jgi:transposase
MRGEVVQQQAMFSYLSPEARVPASHPLRAIKTMADEALQALSATLDQMYSTIGRPSIPPERLLKGELLIALYSIRGHRLFCEQWDYNILFRWVLDMNLEEAVFDHSTFSQNAERLLAHAVAQQFFDAVVRAARREGLLSDEHFTVDGTLIEAWASLKRVTPKADAPASVPPPDDPGNPSVDFHGERRTNATHQSPTDPEARLARKGAGKEAKLCFSGHVLMENRHGLCVDLQIAPAMGTAERDAALVMLRRQARRWIRPQTLGGDKGSHCRDFVCRLRQRGIRPHLACVRGRRTPGLDGRTTRHAGYVLSQRIRKRVEEIIGWIKPVGGLRRTRFRGLARTQHAAYLVGAAYNLLRIGHLRARLAPA